MKKPILILMFLILTAGSLFVVRAVISNRISTSGVGLGETQDELKKVKTENIMLSEKVADASSLSNLQNAAEKLGFLESKSNFAIARARPIALKQ